MTNYYLKIFVKDITGSIKEIEIMKDKDLSLKGAQELTSILNSTGLLKKIDEEYDFYPSHRILKIKLIPRLVATIG